MRGTRWTTLAAVAFGAAVLGPLAARAQTAAAGFAALNERCNQGGFDDGIDHDGVISACTTILGSSPSAFETANAHLHRGMSYDGKHQDELAEQDFTAALTVLAGFHLTAPDDLAAWHEMTGRTWFGRCVARHNLKHYQGAISDCSNALALLNGDPNVPSFVQQAHEFRGGAYYELGNYELSLADFKAAQQLAPDDLGALVGLARAEKTLGQLRHDSALLASSERHVARAREISQSRRSPGQ
jgi:tetratricopeptide (TPR) repeat protein